MLNLRCWRKAAYCLVLVAFVAAMASGPAQARSRKSARASRHHHALPVARGDIYSGLVIEANSGRVLYADSATSLRHPASLTKMMTLYLTFQALEADVLAPEQKLPVSVHAAAQSPSKLGLRPGQSIRVQDAIMAVVTESANDAAVVLAEAMGGSESRFADMMTKQARALGMSQTTFENASGLPDPDQVTTARDMAILANALIYHYPRYYAVFSHETFAYAGRVHHNHNHLMERYDGMDGIKTGYIRASGFNLVASAQRGGRRLIGVVFGGKSTASRDNHMAELLDNSFEGATSAGTLQAGQEAQGDAEDGQYVALPKKVAAIFGPTRRAVAQAAPEAQAPAVVPPSPPQVRPLASAWGIQVGAYNDNDAGQQVLGGMMRDLSPLLDHVTPVLEKAQTSDGGTVYRARFIGMEQAKARSVCAYIVKRGQGCVVVSPDITNGS